MKKYEVIEHTADIGLRIYARDLKELFINAAVGLFSLITDLKKVNTCVELRVELKEENREELIVSWLNELLFQFSTHDFIPKEFKIDKISEEDISARIFGEKIDLDRHKILSEIKAATYHDLEIKEIKEGFSARIIFDT